MNMPPRPSQMHAMVNPDALRMQGSPVQQEPHQALMRGQQGAQAAVVQAENRGPQQIGGLAEAMRGQEMDTNSQIAHADALAREHKAGVLKGLHMNGVPLHGMENIAAVARQMGIPIA